MAVSQHAIHAGESIHAPIWAHPQASYCPQASESIPVQNGIGCRAGKSIIQMLLQQHQVTAGGIQLAFYRRPKIDSSRSPGNLPLKVSFDFIRTSDPENACTTFVYENTFPSLSSVSSISRLTKLQINYIIISLSQMFLFMFIVYISSTID